MGAAKFSVTDGGAVLKRLKKKSPADVAGMKWRDEVIGGVARLMRGRGVYGNDGPKRKSGNG